MNIIKLLSGIFLATLMLISAVAHLYNPAFSDRLIPDILPKNVVHILTAVVEIILGVGIFIPAYRTLALQGTLILMIIFLGVHIIDLFREESALGSTTAAVIRIPVQFLFIYMAYIAQGYQSS